MPRWSVDTDRPEATSCWHSAAVASKWPIRALLAHCSVGRRAVIAAVGSRCPGYDCFYLSHTICVVTIAKHSPSKMQCHCLRI